MDLHNGLDIEVYDLRPTDLLYYYYYYYYYMTALLDGELNSTQQAPRDLDGKRDQKGKKNKSF